MKKSITAMLKIGEIIDKYPFTEGFFIENKLDIQDARDETFSAFLAKFSEEDIEDQAMDLTELQQSLDDYIAMMLEFLGETAEDGIESITILPGHNKNGEAEAFERLDVYKSEIISIVGPTGSGKSRFLADIEWTAMGDTPTGRFILINGKEPDKKWRYKSNNKLVAQLSQNMNFVMDLSVEEFIRLHGESRMVNDIEGIIEKILEQGNLLAGERFALNTPVTGLSGGQSRALMIADTAILSSSPIVLIDEIENAGIDRKKALDLLLSEDKIVLMATHDPNLALMAKKRIVINNGGIVKIIETTAEERKVLKKLDAMDKIMQEMRRELRYGEILQDTTDF